MVSQSVERKKYTRQEYLDFEINAEERHEYLDGEIRVMAGGTPNHGKIVLNFGSILNLGLKGKNYDVFVADQRVWIPEKNLYTYPDIFVIEGELQLQEGRKDTLMNPCLIAEVLSNSTQGYDKDEKFKAYRTVPSLQEYVLIDQYSPQIEHYRKTDPNQWLFTEYSGLEAMLRLRVGNLTIPLAEIYDRVNFD